MNKRKQHVIEKAHQLFVEKGYKATSIQDILDHSGISKGTFYNYFPSKSELFKSVYDSIRGKYEDERNNMLIGEDLADMEIFIKQLEIITQSNRRNKLFQLIEEVFVSDDPELKQFIKQTQYKHINWLFSRFLELFGEVNRPYLLDCTILFHGMLQQSFHFTSMKKDPNHHIIEVVRYCVDRLKIIVEDVSKNQVQLFKPELLQSWLPETQATPGNYLNDLYHLSTALKKIVLSDLQSETERIKYIQILEFIQEELMNNKEPRAFLIEGSLLSLKKCSQLLQKEEFTRFEQILIEHVLVEDTN